MQRGELHLPDADGTGGGGRVPDIRLWTIRRDNPGSYNFKRFQGFEPEALEYQRYVPPGSMQPDISPSNPKYALARQVWAKLPLAFTRPAGVCLSRHIPG